MKSQVERRDPTTTDSDKYQVLFENERVRVLEYPDRPGDITSPHDHPGSVMYTLSSFRRKLVFGDRTAVVDKSAGEVSWLEPQRHQGENVGTTDTHVLVVELREPGGGQDG